MDHKVNHQKSGRTEMAKKTTQTTTKKTAQKKSTKKTATKKAAVKKAVKKKTTVKSPARKAVKKKAPAKKKAAAKLLETHIIARVDVGFGNTLFLRGTGAGLSWDHGVAMENIAPYEWSFKTTAATNPIEFKCLINDTLWAEGDNSIVAAGGISISSPVFRW